MTARITQTDLMVANLGPCRIASPLKPLLESRRTNVHYVEEDDRVLFPDTSSLVAASGVRAEALPGFEPAGPRKHIFFDPKKTRVGVVTCGGLCPGINNVIRGLVMELIFHYGVTRIHGFRNGYQGFIPRYAHDVVDLTPGVVSGIDKHGGTLLGTSRGGQDPGEIVDCLERMNINALFVIGGDGTLRGAIQIAATVAERNAMIAVVGIPKTIDNDIPRHRPELWISDCVRRSDEVDPLGTCGGEGLAPWHRAGQIDGPPFRIHRLLRIARRTRCQLRAHPRGALRPRRFRRTSGAPP